MTLEVEKEWTKFSDATAKLTMAHGFQRSSWDWVGLYKVKHEWHIQIKQNLIQLGTFHSIFYFENYAHYVIIIINHKGFLIGVINSINLI